MASQHARHIMNGQTKQVIDPHFPAKIARSRKCILQVFVVLGFFLLVVIEAQTGVMLVCILVAIVYPEQVYLLETEQAA